MPQPTIASVHGHCLTGALELALACDLMITSESANLADTHGKWGMVPGWGMSVRLPRRVGLLKAKEMMFTGMSINGLQAVEIGLSSQCVADDHLKVSTLDLAESIVKNSWHTNFADKKLFLDNENHFHDVSLKMEREQSATVASDMHERVSIPHTHPCIPRHHGFERLYLQLCPPSRSHKVYSTRHEDLLFLLYLFFVQHQIPWSLPRSILFGYQLTLPESFES